VDKLFVIVVLIVFTVTIVAVLITAKIRTRGIAKVQSEREKKQLDEEAKSSARKHD